MARSAVLEIRVESRHVSIELTEIELTGEVIASSNHLNRLKSFREVVSQALKYLPKKRKS